MHFGTKTSGLNNKNGLNFKWSLIQRNFTVLHFCLQKLILLIDHTLSKMLRKLESLQRLKIGGKRD